MLHHKHPKCYAAALGNCSETISSEHFLSESVLTLLNKGDGFKVSGLPWQTPETRQPSIATLGSNILCQAHNEALSLLDKEAKKIFEHFEIMDNALVVGSLPLSRVTEIDGTLFERWVLKATVGMIASGNTAIGTERFPKLPPPLGWLKVLWNYKRDSSDLS
jgi:hypothetical protein